MPPTPAPAADSLHALARDVAEAIRAPLATARLDLASARALLAQPISAEETALATALLRNSQAAVERVHATVAHLARQFAPDAGDDDTPPSFDASWGCRILIVDDQATVLEMMARVLKGFDVVLLESPREALARIVAGERFAFILSDLMMTEMTGDALFREIERAAPEQAARFIFLSGGSLSDEASEGLRAAERPVIAKPFRRPLLMNLLAGLASFGDLTNSTDFKRTDE